LGAYDILERGRDVESGKDQKRVFRPILPFSEGDRKAGRKGMRQNDEKYVGRRKNKVKVSKRKVTSRVLGIPLHKKAGKGKGIMVLRGEKQADTMLDTGQQRTMGGRMATASKIQKLPWLAIGLPGENMVGGKYKIGVPPRTEEYRRWAEEKQKIKCAWGKGKKRLGKLFTNFRCPGVEQRTGKKGRKEGCCLSGATTIDLGLYQKTKED